MRKRVGNFSDVVTNLEKKLPDIIRRLTVTKSDRRFRVVRWREVIVWNFERRIVRLYNPMPQGKKLGRLRL